MTCRNRTLNDVAAGKETVYPRSCPVCSFGPCKEDVSVDDQKWSKYGTSYVDYTAKLEKYLKDSGVIHFHASPGEAIVSNNERSKSLYDSMQRMPNNYGGKYHRFIHKAFTPDGTEVDFNSSEAQYYTVSKSDLEVIYKYLRSILNEKAFIDGDFDRPNPNFNSHMWGGADITQLHLNQNLPEWFKDELRKSYKRNQAT